MKAIARAKGRDVDDLTVIILDRPRHAALIETVRQTGARIRLIHDGDVSGGVSTALDDTGIDVLLGVGGSPEAVITAAALKCLGGEIQCKLWPHAMTGNDNTRPNMAWTCRRSSRWMTW